MDHPASPSHPLPDQVLVGMVLARTYRRLIAAGIPKFWPSGHCVGMYSRLPIAHSNPRGLADWYWPDYHRANLWPGLVRAAIKATQLPPMFAIVYVPGRLTPAMVQRLIGRKLRIPAYHGLETEPTWVQAFTPGELRFPSCDEWDASLIAEGEPDGLRMLTMLAAIGIQLDGQPFVASGKIDGPKMVPSMPTEIPLNANVRLAQFPEIELIWTPGEHFEEPADINVRHLKTRKRATAC